MLWPAPPFCSKNRSQWILSLNLKHLVWLQNTKSEETVDKLYATYIGENKPVG
jgi:hypothetical protein